MTREMPDARAGPPARADGSGRVGNGSTVRRKPAYAAPEGGPKAGPSGRQGGSGGRSPPDWGSGGYPPG